MIAWLNKPATRAWAAVPYVAVALVLLIQASSLGHTDSTAATAHETAMVAHRATDATHALAVRTSQLASALQASIQRQLSNRANNVLVWCAAINSQRSYDGAFVRYAFHKRLRYGLRQLPCKKLSTRTLASAH